MASSANDDAIPPDKHYVSAPAEQRTKILDEIHSIGQESGGAVWEQILLLAPCPIIGLSATIGSPEVFNSWLERVQTSHNFAHTFIEHPHRYSHLRKYHYALDRPIQSVFRGLSHHRSTERTAFIHPITMLSPNTNSIPSDLALEASDALTLYQAMNVHRNKLGVVIDTLEPTTFFAGRGLLKQKDIIEYETKLKSVITTLMTSEDAWDPSSPFLAVKQELDKFSPFSAKDALSPPSRIVLRKNILPLLADLHVTDQLPAILFSFDRKDCELTVDVVVNALERAETRWKESDPTWLRKVKQWEDWVSRAKDREHAATMAKKQTKQAKLDEAQDSAISWQSKFDPSDPLPEFSFSGDQYYTRGELEKDIADLSWTSTPEWAIKALRRGIACHHSGMNKAYRSLVESLFRRRFIRVIIATGTLALGINAPAKTAVFLGDSPFLTALMYRQCAGRAGRRGFDLRGNVIFYGLPKDRIERLMLSRLPSLGQNFPFTTTLTLRLLNLLHGSNNAAVAESAVTTMLTFPQTGLVSDVGKQQLLHHVRFSIDYLRRRCLVNRGGEPTGLFGVAAHLYYTEPSNFALVVLFQSGLLHKICTQSGFEMAKHEYITLIAHLFNRREIPESLAKSEELVELTRRHPSMIILPPLRSDAKKEFRKHNEEILQNFLGYLEAFVTSNTAQLPEDDCLPLSNMTFGGALTSSPLLTHLQNTAVRSTVRSPFVANSGLGDNFKTVTELCNTARNGLHLNKEAIPSLDHLVNDEKPMNAHVVDFYVHGQDAALAHANGIRRGDVWYILQDVTLTLKTVETAFYELMVQRAKTSSAVQGVTNAGSEGDSWDSGYGDDNEEDEGGDGQTAGYSDSDDGGEVRLSGKPDQFDSEDRKVFKVIQEVRMEFEKKFKAMWA